MPICYLFTEYLQEDGCIMLQLDDDGEEILPPMHYEFAEIKRLQNDSKTILVYPCSKVSIFNLELPWLVDKKARAAIPFALEERLSQSIELLHFAFDKKHYKNHQYEVAVMEKQGLQDLMALFENMNVQYNQITLDWYALHPQEIICTNDTLLVNTEQFKGALSPELSQIFKNMFADCEIFTFPDCKTNLELPNQNRLEEASTTWIAKRLFINKPMNLCQGSLQHGTVGEKMRKGYMLASLLGVVWLISIIAVNAFNLYSVNAQIQKQDAQIAKIYKDFFPDSKQVINPKFRISQLLGTQTQTRFVFWNLFKKLAQGLRNSPVKVEQLRFANKSLFATVAAPDFAALEKLEDTLKGLQLNVNQTQASTKQQQVLATLELQ